MRRLLLATMVAILVNACGDTAPTTTTAAPPTTTSTTASSVTTTAAVVTTTAVPETTTTIREADVTVTDGVVDGPDMFEYTVGDQVDIIVLVDVADEIHVHSYDIMFDTEPGVPVEISFEADVQGIFEVELEGTSLPLFEIQVTP